MAFSVVPGGNKHLYEESPNGRLVPSAEILSAAGSGLEELKVVLEVSPGTFVGQNSHYLRSHLKSYAAYSTSHLGLSYWFERLQKAPPVPTARLVLDAAGEMGGGNAGRCANLVGLHELAHIFLTAN